MKATIYHNSRCSKCRATLALLEEHDVDIEMIEYLTNPPTKEKLEELLAMLGMEACDLMRRSEEVYKEQYADKELSREECLNAMVANPVLIERPIVVSGGRAVLGRPPENVLKLIKS